MKTKCWLNKAVQEGILFLLLSGWLIAYSLDAYRKSYIKDWTQSPSLFPLIVAVLLGVLALITLVRGFGESRDDTDAAGKNGGRVLVLLGMSLAYDLVLAFLKLPYMAVHVFSLTLTFSAFEPATVVFLLAMMVYLGVRSKPVLIAVPLGVTLFLSVMFRTLLHVLLP